MTTTSRNPWAWIPTLYFAQGIPYVMVMTVSVIMYKRLGISNTDIALYTSWLYLPWVLKPLWSPLVDITRTKRFWVVSMQFLVSLGLASVAFAVRGSGFFRWSLFLFWIMAFASATHDIAADGFYMLGLDQHRQAAFVGVRSTFYRVATITGQGLLVVLAGTIEQSSGGNIPVARSVTFAVLSAIFLVLFVYHRFMLPYPAEDRPAAASTEGRTPAQEFFSIFAEFFRKPDILAVLAFLLLYRFAEAQLVKLVSPFLLDPRSRGGLGLTTSEVGVVYGTVGIIALTLGGLLGGYAASRGGLRRWLWPMVAIIHLPDLMFVYLSQVQPESFLLINLAVAVEQFGYGFGFTAYMLFMILVAEGRHKTAHYAICTGFMALGMMLPGMWSGNAARFLGVSPRQVPSSFRDLRSSLHLDDSLYNEISRALRTSEQHVCWPIRLKDADGGWKAFALRGKISRDATSGLPVIDVDGRDNLDSAREAARLAGIPDKLITQRLKKLPRIPGRQEIVHQSQRLTVVNDSSAVGPTQTIYALGRWGGPNSILITGGQGSGDYSEWADCVRSNIRPANLVFLTGSATVKMRSALRDHARGVRAYDSLADAWRAARQRSGKYVKAVILFSPSAGEDELLDNGSNAGHRFNSLVKGEN